MNKEQIEEIIKNIAESGHVLENKTITDTSVSLIYYNCNFSLNLKGTELVVEVNIAFGYHTLFYQEDVDWLNSITDDWDIYNHCISFSFTPKDNEELKKILLRCIECF